MHAISIKQPWVEQILQGIKTREFRSQPTKLLGRVYLYASLKPRREPNEWRKTGKTPDEVPHGSIVGTVMIVRCDEIIDGYAYILAEPRRFAKVRKAKNQPQPRFWIPKF